MFLYITERHRQGEIRRKKLLTWELRGEFSNLHHPYQRAQFVLSTLVIKVMLLVLNWRVCLNKEPSVCLSVTKLCTPAKANIFSGKCNCNWITFSINITRIMLVIKTNALGLNNFRDVLSYFWWLRPGLEYHSEEPWWYQTVNSNGAFTE